MIQFCMKNTDTHALCICMHTPIYIKGFEDRIQGLNSHLYSVDELCSLLTLVCFLISKMNSYIKSRDLYLPGYSVNLLSLPPHKRFLFYLLILQNS